MDNKFDKTNLLGYLNNPISKESISVIYASNNIKYEKCELYNDFVQSLLLLAFSTYLGDEYMTIQDQIKHFRWCWNKVVENFKEEGIYFKNPRLYNYFLEFMLEVFYMNEGKEHETYNHISILKIWENIFNYERQKTQADIDTMIEVYNIFEKSLIIE